ncbi:sigma factor-like helix-turn-helix DNA-binding protein [Paenibacillus sp. YN15]|uniref:sigma factor-like helix-turn-helix DNA-binding protein n=1 Tax=Paenibacillus sp. YN15 TaxID=1742774 RepID=UPI000DCC3F5F|nr:RNA polymerase subunit sigma [Paenibacillus sp. YN15]RAV05157.1 RNA polymerase subunit sigma [Paenibacillus sp. YN15]
MGLVKVDIEKDQRKLSARYALNDKTGVRELLCDQYHIASRRYKGDTAASDILIDLDSAIRSAGLTERQTKALAYVYGSRQLSQKEAALVMGVRQNTVSELLDMALERIAASFRRWDYEELVVVHAASWNEVEGGEASI